MKKLEQLADEYVKEKTKHIVLTDDLQSTIRFENTKRQAKAIYMDCAQDICKRIMEEVETDIQHRKEYGAYLDGITTSGLKQIIKSILE